MGRAHPTSWYKNLVYDVHLYANYRTPRTLASRRRVGPAHRLGFHPLKFVIPGCSIYLNLNKNNRNIVPSTILIRHINKLLRLLIN